nr:putative zinc finger A20 and AN1 domain-containing stress-associated protein 8 [Nicotiana tomentosiformis]
MTSCDKAENSSLYARGCGFYGNPSNYNICSQFYKAFLKEESVKSAITLSEKLYFLTVDDTVKTENEDGLTMKTKTERIHMYPEELTCTFNFKYMGRALLVKKNPLCKADKFEYRI